MAEPRSSPFWTRSNTIITAIFSGYVVLWCLVTFRGWPVWLTAIDGLGPVWWSAVAVVLCCAKRINGVGS